MFRCLWTTETADGVWGRRFTADNLYTKKQQKYISILRTDGGVSNWSTMCLDLKANMIILQAFLDRPFYVFVFICSLEAKWYDRWREVSSGKPWIISSISTEVSATEPDESSQLPSQCNRLGALIQRWNFLAQRGAHQTLPPYIHSFQLLVWDWLLNAATRGKTGGQRTPSWLLWRTDWHLVVQSWVVDLSIRLFGLQVGHSE